MYVLHKSKNILTLVTIGYIVGFIVGIYIEYCYGPKWPYWIYIAYICETPKNPYFLRKGKMVI